MITQRGIRAACATAIAVIAFSARLRGADAYGPRELLARLPASTSLTVLAFDGALKPVPGIQRWRLFVNDSMVFESPATAARSTTPLAIGLILRLGDNVVVLESVRNGQAGTPLEHWTKHVYRQQTIGARQFAVLAQGEVGDTATLDQLDTFRRALIDNGVPEANIRKVSSAETLADTLNDLGKQTAGRDQVLIYYSGSGRLSRVNAEPELTFSKSPPEAVVSLPVGDLIREAADLPSASVLLDIAYTPSWFGALAPTIGPRQSARGAGAPWLRTISDSSSVELAYTNPFVAENSASRGFTRDFVDKLSTISADTCNTFAGVAQSVATQNSQKLETAWPVFYTGTPSSFRFCPPTSATKPPALSIAAAPSIDANPPLRFVDVRIPMAAAPSGLRVDGVPVSLRPTALGQGNTASQRVPVGPGRHVVDLLAEADAGAPGMSGAAGVVTSALGYTKWSSDLTAELQLAGISPATSDTSVALSFIVGDRENRPVQYEVRNNGVVLLQDVVNTPSQPRRRQTVRRIPLALGTNNVVLDVMRGDRYSSARATVLRRRAQPVRAVIVGVDSPVGVAPLASAEADARRMNDLLLRYTDAVPSRIRLLTGARATRQAVRDAIDELSLARTANLPQAPADDTFLFYFAGYGFSIGDQTSGSVRRCIVLSDFDPDRASDTCLSTTDLDAALDTVGRAVVIVDTSYDGRAGEHSRTYRTYTAPDTRWRLTSGTEHPDRVFLVANGSNSPALESADGGFFTLALDKAIRGQLDKPGSNGLQELSLLQAYERSREDTSARSDRRQIPVMKGVLSAPFVFVLKPLNELKHEAAGIERAAHNDVISMRALDAERVARAALLYDKILTLDGDDADAHLGRARVLLLLGDLIAARQAVDNAVRLLPDPNSPAAADWLFLRAELKVRTGDIEGAIADAERSCANGPSNPASAALLGMLYAVAGQHDKSLAQLQPLLSKQASEDRRLTDEDLGRVLLHTYLSLRRSGQRSNAKLLLKSFSNTFTGKGRLLKLTYQNRVIEKLLPRRSRAVSMGQIGVHAPWSYVVAQFLRGGTKNARLLYSFRSDAEPYDPLDGTAFDCLLHFYVGMARALDRDFKHAHEELQKVADTGKIDYVEYWFSKAEMARLTR
jgi:tetratricopeptide (TPR) repeat protein